MSKVRSIESYVGDDEVTVEFILQPAEPDVNIPSAYAEIQDVIKDGVSIVNSLSDGVLQDLEVKCAESCEWDYDDGQEYDAEE